MGNFRFIDIEDFENAYRERMQDYLKFIETYNGHEIMLMHLGGIIIECYLKDLIVKKYGITKRINMDIWNTDEQVLQINSNHQLSKKSILNQGLGISNPKHNIIEAYKKIDEIKDLIASNESLTRKFENLNNPLKKDGSNFIDLRYSTRDDFNNIDQIFKLWEKDFKDVLRF